MVETMYVMRTDCSKFFRQQIKHRSFLFCDNNKEPFYYCMINEYKKMQQETRIYQLLKDTKKEIYVYNENQKLWILTQHHIRELQENLYYMESHAFFLNEIYPEELKCLKQLLDTTLQRQGELWFIIRRKVRN